MEIYLLKSAACLAVFFSFYKLLLERESIHTLKRYYLLGSLVASFVIPLITFTSYIEISEGFTQIYTGENTPKIVSGNKETINYLPIILWSIYGMGVLFFSFKFFRNLNGLIQKIRKNPTYKVKNIINVLLQESVVPHTFFSFIFLNQQKFKANEIPKEVLWHEQTHAFQKHSIDVVFIELLQIVFWFNPLIYLIKRAIKLNHEFLADKAVLNRGMDTTKYQQTLLAFSSSANSPILANSINYSSIKKRFTVMKTISSKKAVWLRSFFLLPLSALLIYGFSTKEIIPKEKNQVKESTTPNKLIQSNNEVEINTFAQEKATKKEVTEYNQLAKKYNAVDIEKRIIKKKDLERLETIYKKMSDDQKANAEPFPECIPKPPPVPEAPKVSEIMEVERVSSPPFPKAVKKITTYKTATGEVVEIEEVPLYPQTVEIIEEVDVSTPPVPAIHLKELADKGAVFYWEEKEINAKEARELVTKKYNTINISVTEKNSQKPIVKLSTKPIMIETTDNNKP